MRRFIQDLAAKNGHQPVHLLEILRAVQSRYHYVPTDAVELLAGLLKIPRTRIIDVVEFYSFFSNTPKGRYELLISELSSRLGLLLQKLVVRLPDLLPRLVDSVVVLNKGPGKGRNDRESANGLADGLSVTVLDLRFVLAFTEGESAHAYNRYEHPDQ